MRFQHLALVINFLALGTFGLPNSPLHDLFTDPNIPVLSNLDLSIVNITGSTPHKKGSEKRAINVGYLLYSITMDGRNQGNFENFIVSGQMLITQGIPSSATQNGQNPYDIVIIIGSPSVNPVAGSIRYATNRYLYKFIGGSNANSLLDFVYVTNTGSTIGVTVDTRIAAANQLSNFNARTGLTMNAYEVASGGFSVTLGTTALSGSINVIGTGYIFSGTAPYKAVISGTIIGRGTTTI
jgi:hypothetical protein